MIDADVLAEIFSNAGLFLALVAGVVAVQWLALRPLRVQVLHPFAFFYFFNYSVGYAVTLLFVQRFDTNGRLFAYILVCAVVIVAALRRGFAAGSADRAWRSVDTLSDCEPRTMFIWASAASVLLFGVFAATGANTIVAESRFAAAAGFGIIIRLAEAFAIIALCFSPLAGGSSGTGLLAVGAVLFAAAQVLLAGSKGGVLEALLWFVLLAQRSGRKLPYVRIAAIAVISVATFATVLSYNLEGMGIDIEAVDGRYTDLPIVYEMGLARIIANGDSYYFTLPPEVEPFISRELKLAPLQVLFQIIGGAAGGPFGVDVHNNEPGRQAFLFWYPDAPMGGPTNHLDLAFYFYLGPILGVLAVAAVAFFIGWLHGAIMKAPQYTSKIAVLTVLYCKTLIALLSPSIAAQRLTDAVVAMGILAALARVRSATRTS